MSLTDTIAAIATPVGEGAISVLRLSGPEAASIVARLFRARRPGNANLPIGEDATRCNRGAPAASERLANQEIGLPRPWQPRRPELGALYNGDLKIDEVLLTHFPAPASYTGEDVIELSGHGGLLVTRRLLDLLLKSGARLAEPGEFTQRAFLHGKLDLTQAEAVMDLITAQTDLALRAAHEQLSGTLGRRIASLREHVLELLAHVEAYIDFPDEDIAPETGDALHARLTELRGDLEALLATAARGQILREGVRTVIYGAPNVGKSSLLNLLLGYDRAIVSPTPGTTRDSIEEVINLRGLPLRLVDTAGIRAAADAVEQAGIERTQRELVRAGLVLHVHDATQPPEQTSPANHLVVLNKTDLGEHPAWAGVSAVRLSCHTGAGTADLEDAIEHAILGGPAAQRDWSVAINARHQAHLRQALAYLQAAQEALHSGISAEFVAEELRAALNALGDIIGRLDTEDLLGKIFSTFCIGK
ncbi:MAG TPA: tRNA uridine-5-carboxymethylaminomethyl(34) synthesis GTPase MnmE [Chthoniobacteraceae bacterium]|jgi:tRNA modification GTPase|nr:tRNA uridine-5-carboxymethylaminomethyl(34) synthesis GTPase MnmE [Chthoniobacteraceae bacterium]